MFDVISRPLTTNDDYFRDNFTTTSIERKHQQKTYKQPIMSTRIPTSTSVTESSVIPASLTDVWHLIKLQDFHNFWTKLAKSQHVKGASPETDIVKWTFKDGTEQEVKQEEHSVYLPFPFSQIQCT